MGKKNVKKPKFIVRVQWSNDKSNGFVCFNHQNEDDALKNYNKIIDEQLKGQWAIALDGQGGVKNGYIHEEHTPNVHESHFYLKDNIGDLGYIIVLISEYKEDKKED